jgi:3-oxoacyl-[acyl-carrier-protein] synthase II
MKPMWVNGLGLVGGFGCGKVALLNALREGSVPVTQTELRGSQFPLFKAATDQLENYLNKRTLRRIDHFSRMALLGAFQALEDTGGENLDRSRLGVVVCSGFGALNTTFKFLDSVLEDGDTFASPTAFSNSVHNAAAAHISIQLNISGPSLTVNQFDQSLVSGLLTAQTWLEEGRVDAVLLGVVDEYSSVLGYCWQRFLGCRDTTEMRPLDFSATTAIIGEGAAFFLLQSNPAKNQSYGKIEPVEMGTLHKSRPQLPKAQPVLLSCDGFPATGSLYQQQLSGAQLVGCYTPLYGVSPVSPAFDLAVGALSLQRGHLFPSVDSGGDYFTGSVIDRHQSCRTLSCLRFSMMGEYAAIHLSKEES